MTSAVATRILDVAAMLSTLAAETSQPVINDPIRKPMSVRRYVGAALVTASAAILPIGAPPAVAEPVNPSPCDKEWLPPHDRGICDNDPTTGPVPPAPPGGPMAPAAPGGPLSSRPGGPR
jgi:hypothetical protein